jgi:dCMP deaminase
MPLTDEELAAIDPIENVKKKPSFNAYFLAIANLVAERSLDPSTKCGAVIVSKEKRILSTGYNSPLRGSIDEEIPLTRPERYKHMIHAEENAIIAYNGSYEDINGATIYVTGRPCHRCLRMIINKGITNIIYGHNKTHVVDKADIEASDLMLKHHPEVCSMRHDFSKEIIALLNKTINRFG